MTLLTAIEKRASQIADTAAQHNGRYYLHRLYRRAPAWEPKGDTELEHDAAQWMVGQGLANWITGKCAVHVRPHAVEALRR